MNWDSICKNILKIKEIKPNIDDIEYPGIFGLKKHQKYFNNFKKFYTPPRGNLFSKIVFIGYKPGTKFKHLYKCESAWLFGPSSKTLLDVLKEIKLFPYFTNLIKDESNLSLKEWTNILLDELNFLKNEYDFDRFVFLGNYKEYNDVFEKFNSFKVYHPSYVRRFNKKEIFKKQLLKILS